MTKLIRKLLAAAAITAIGLAAAPANAWYSYTYFNPDGSVAGGQIFCDNGYLYYSEGTQTSSYYLDAHYGEPPC